MMAAQLTSALWRLGELLRDVASVSVDDDRGVTGLSADSRATEPGHVFFARHGTHDDGRVYIDAAVAAGAAAVVIDQHEAPLEHRIGVPVIAVPDLKRSLGLAADRYYGHPSRYLRVVGVTGTNGKTTVSHGIAQALHGWQRANRKRAQSGVIGTLGNGLYGALEPGINTTPGAIELHQTLGAFRAQGADYAVMEVSSHGLDQGRVAGVHFHTAVFTNLSRDHLDYHATLAEYAEAKAALFDSDDLKVAVINADDPFGQALLTRLSGAVETVPYSLCDPGVACYGRVSQKPEQPRAGLVLEVNSDWGDATLETSLLGRFNGQNLLAIIAALVASGMPFATAIERLSGIGPLPGRMERIESNAGAPLVVVDYAHTPDALGVVLDALREQCRGALWCVFGCGGDRDRGKRPEMGMAVSERADVAVVTDDNPRFEDAQQIIEQTLDGFAQRDAALVIPDRAAAIRHAVRTAAPEDTVLVAGKGHEPYQEIEGVRRPFSDANAIRAALAERAS